MELFVIIFTLNTRCDYVILYNLTSFFSKNPVELFFNRDSFHARMKATTKHGVTRKIRTKRLKNTGNLFRKNLQLKGVC